MLGKRQLSVITLIILSSLCYCSYSISLSDQNVTLISTDNSTETSDFNQTSPPPPSPSPSPFPTVIIATLAPTNSNSSASASAGGGGDGEGAKCPNSPFACMGLRQNFGAYFGLMCGLIFLMYVLNRVFYKLHISADEVDKLILSNAFEELSILGVLSCVLFMLYAFTDNKLMQFHNFVAFVFMVIVVTILMYAVFLAYLSWQRKGVEKEWQDFDQFIALRSQDGMTVRTSASRILFESFSGWKQKRFIIYEGVRRHFLLFHSLPGTFQFSKYLADCYDFLVLKFTRVKWRIGTIILCWMILSLIMYPISNSGDDLSTPTYSVAQNGYLFLTAALINWVLCVLCIITYFLVERFINQLLEESLLSGEDLRLIHCESLQMIQAKGIVEDFEDDNDSIEQEMKYSQTMQVLQKESRTSRQHFEHGILGADKKSPLNSSDLGSTMNSGEEKKIIDHPFVDEDPFSTMALLNDRIPKEVRRRRRTRLQYWCPMIFEDDPYRRRFPFATPNFVLRLTQFTLLFQALFACLFFLIYIPEVDWSNPMDVIFCILWCLPVIQFAILFGPRSLRWLAMMRYSGPIAKIHFMAKHLPSLEAMHLPDSAESTPNQV
jgi:hypothetical protein